MLKQKEHVYEVLEIETYWRKINKSRISEVWQTQKVKVKTDRYDLDHMGFKGLIKIFVLYLKGLLKILSNTVV